jgi:hypothetical protein
VKFYCVLPTQHASSRWPKKNCQSILHSNRSSCQVTWRALSKRKIQVEDGCERACYITPILCFLLLFIAVDRRTVEPSNLNLRAALPRGSSTLVCERAIVHWLFVAPASAGLKAGDAVRVTRWLGECCISLCY